MDADRRLEHGQRPAPADVGHHDELNRAVVGDNLGFRQGDEECLAQNGVV